MKVLRNIIIVLLSVIFVVKIVFFLRNEVGYYFHKKEFLSKYEFEDFSRFKGVDMAYRGKDKYENFVFFGSFLHIVNDSLEKGDFVVILDKNNYQAVEIDLMHTNHYTSNDTVKLQHLAQTFIRYKIGRLFVDEQGNVFIYLEDFDSLALARFVNENELLKQRAKWVSIKGNWYERE